MTAQSITIVVLIGLLAIQSFVFSFFVRNQDISAMKKEVLREIISYRSEHDALVKRIDAQTKNRFSYVDMVNWASSLQKSNPDLDIPNPMEAVIRPPSQDNTGQ